MFPGKRLGHNMILIPVLDWTEWRFRALVLEEDHHPRWRCIPYLSDRIVSQFFRGSLGEITYFVNNLSGIPGRPLRDIFAGNPRLARVSACHSRARPNLLKCQPPMAHIVP